MDDLPIKPRILIVDDTPANLLAFELVLEKDFSPFLAESGPAALELAQRADFATILLDVRMPGLDGRATAQELRRREKTRYTPILFTSAVERNPGNLLSELDGGPADLVLTPIEPEFLIFKVAALVRMHLHHRALQFQIERMAGQMRSLRGEIAQASRLDRALQEQIRELERMSAELKRRAGALESSPA